MPESALAARAALASVDLSSYDPEQSRLMSEKCILVDEQDNAIGAVDKQICAFSSRFSSFLLFLTFASLYLGHLMENINMGLLHRAFSAFIFRPSDGKLLLQQRASEKITFPDMWTNTCCSHPLDDFDEEKIEKDQLGVRIAASRKLEHELGIPRHQTSVDEFQYLTRIHYLAPSNGLWGEHEGIVDFGFIQLESTQTGDLLVDYILFLTANVTVKPNPNEIRAYKYVSKDELKKMFDDPGKYSHNSDKYGLMIIDTANLFTPWFKLIARDFLFGWWDELYRRPGADGQLRAKNLAGVADGSKVIKMA